MNIADLELEQWNSLSDGERYSIAQKLLGQLPDSFHFNRIQSYEVGNIRNYVAKFSHEASVFVLIPGSTVTLGYDPDHPFQPSPKQLQSWQSTVSEYEIKYTLNEFIYDTATTLRTVEIHPFLLEVTAKEIGMEPIEMEGLHNAYQVTWYTHGQITEQVASQGFRLPTSNEWEYACSANSRTLFHWGDDCPTDCYPDDLECQDYLHRHPNTFGLHIAQDPYDWEFVAEAKVLMRGGDGGKMLCGGAGFFVGWLTLASAFIDKYAGDHYEGKEVPEGHLRRAFSLT